jgi:hypothetical protein
MDGHVIIIIMQKKKKRPRPGYFQSINSYQPPNEPYLGYMVSIFNIIFSYAKQTERKQTYQS